MTNKEIVTLTIEVDMDYRDYQILMIFGFDFKKQLKEYAEEFIEKCAEETREIVLKREKHDK